MIALGLAQIGLGTTHWVANLIHNTVMPRMLAIVLFGVGWLRVVRVSMNWVYDRVVRHKCVNYHIWRANDGANTVYALTRTSALEPKHVPSYRSMEEVFWKTGVQVEPASAGSQSFHPPSSKPAVGIFRTRDGWAEVDYGHRTGAVPRDLYDRKGYRPAYEKLPLETIFREPLPDQRQARH